MKRPGSMRRQRGNGILSGIFTSLSRILKPIAQKTLINLGERAIEAGGDIVSDVVSGKSLKSSLQNRAKQHMPIAREIIKSGLNQGTADITNSLKKQLGKGKVSVARKLPTKRKSTGIFTFSDGKNKKKKFSGIFE